MRNHRFRSRASLLLVAAAAAALFIACSSVLGPSGACGERWNVRVCVEEDAYAPGSTVHFRIENRRDETVLHDGCALQVATRLDPAVPWNEVYDHRGHCGFEPPPEVIEANIVELPAGETVRDSISLPGGSPQVQARLHVWLVSAEGELLFPRPTVSGKFSIFRTG